MFGFVARNARFAEESLIAFGAQADLDEGILLMIHAITIGEKILALHL